VQSHVWRIAIGVDLAYTAKKKADYSCAVVMAADGKGTCYVLDVVRAQVEAPVFASMLKNLIGRYPVRPRWYAAGTEHGVAQMMESMGIKMEVLPPAGDKFVRAMPCAAGWNASRISVPMNAAWSNAFVEEVLAFTGTGDLHDDQVDALHAAAQEHPLDLTRVAIRGWSFGGYLAALAVLRRPDVFHAAIAGAPVTEWRLYDTHYTERYLGDPGADPEPYDESSLLPLADQLTRPLLLVHGLADDNVVAAHTLQLSSALLAAGKPHEVLPLVGVTHMTPQEVVAENLLLHQLDFLRRSLALG
jgi:predicted phage terminase large subunit-like protein